MNENLFTVDKIMGIEVDPNKYLNEFNALLQLKTGLIALYNSVRPHEIEIINKAKEEGMKVSFFGYSSRISEQLIDILPCYFHWFGISVCNYARLAGFIVAKEQGHVTVGDLQLEPEREKIRVACNKCVKSILELQEVLKWRNKVAAHFALTDPKKDDNIATMEASIIYPVGFEDDRFRTGTVIFSKGPDSEIPCWALTETFELLINRFWPDVTLN